MQKKIFLFTGLLALFICSSSIVIADESSNTEILPTVVTTDWLAKNYNDSDIVVLHLGPRGSYEEQHIPGSQKASLKQLLRENEVGIRDEMVLAKDATEILKKLGIGKNSRIILYFSEENAAWAAARYLLTLEYFGMGGRVAYLDGGLPKWIAEERPVSQAVPLIETADLTVEIAPDVIVNTEWLSTRYENSGIAILDGRPIEKYTGLTGHWDRPGHISGAGNIPYFTLLAEEPPYLLKSREELSNMYVKAGAEPGDTVIVYCGTGLWASLLYLGARHLDYEVRLYDGSFQEWSATENLPVSVQGKNENQIE